MNGRSTLWCTIEPWTTHIRKAIRTRGDGENRTKEGGSGPDTPVQMTLVHKVKAKKDVTQGTRTSRKTVAPGVVACVVRV
jgi:hypothetical protein